MFWHENNFSITSISSNDLERFSLEKSSEISASKGAGGWLVAVGVDMSISQQCRLQWSKSILLLLLSGCSHKLINYITVVIEGLILSRFLALAPPCLFLRLSIKSVRSAFYWDNYFLKYCEVFLLGKKKKNYFTHLHPFSYAVQGRESSKCRTDAEQGWMCIPGTSGLSLSKQGQAEATPHSLTRWWGPLEKQVNCSQRPKPALFLQQGWDQPKQTPWWSKTEIGWEPAGTGVNQRPCTGSGGAVPNSTSWGSGLHILPIKMVFRISWQTKVFLQPTYNWAVLCRDEIQLHW